MRYEYNTTIRKFVTVEFEMDFLNDQGLVGWELIQRIQIGDNVRFIFKRELPAMGSISER